jgi:hypothetical protein
MKKMMWVVFVIFLIGLTGCKQQATVGSTFIGGTEGLKTAFLPGSPPAQIYDEGNYGFSIIVDLKNVGETTIKKGDGYVRISGLDAGSIGTSTLQKDIDVELEGARRNEDGSTTAGGQTQVEFDNLKFTPSIQGQIESVVWADVCYHYTSKATTQLCIKKSAEDVAGQQKICTIDGNKDLNPQNSGAPIHVKTLKEVFRGQGKIGITVELEHQGTGDAFFKDTENICDNVLSNPAKNRVFVKFKPMNIGGRQVYPECSGLNDGASASEGYIRLSDDAGGKSSQIFVCSIDVSSANGIFQAPVDMEISYLYLQHIQTPLVIKHVSK